MRFNSVFKGLKNVFAVEIGLLAECDSCAPFPSAKWVLVVPLLHHPERRQLHSNEDVEMALGEWLRLQESSYNSNGVLKSICVGIILKNN